MRKQRSAYRSRTRGCIMGLVRVGYKTSPRALACPWPLAPLTHNICQWLLLVTSEDTRYAMLLTFYKGDSD